jgi:hypothetical protein
VVKPTRWTREEWDQANLTLYVRSSGVCWWCARSLRDTAVRHHRMRRREGGDSFQNLLLLHPTCHAEVHAQPTNAQARGFIVPTWAEPLQVSIEVLGVRWYLDDQGGRVRV